MRALRHLLLTTAAAVLVAAGCAAPRDAADPLAAAGTTAEPAPREAPEAEPTHHRQPPAEVALCTVLPKRLVGDLVDARIIDADGVGTQCTWRLQAPDPGPGGVGPDLAAGRADEATLQGAFLDLGAFHTGRPPAGEAGSVVELAGVGDEAYVVHVGDGAPSTLYVRDGQRALSLWLTDGGRAPHATEASLSRVASLLIDLA